MEEIPLNRTEPERAITLKSLFFGLLGVLVVSGLAGFHDTHIPGPPMISMHLATAAFFYIFMVGFVWNLAVSRIMPGLTLSTRELIVVFGMTLVACFPPTSGLCRYFQRQLMLPWYYLNAGGKTDWEKFGIMDYLPGKLFPTPVPVMKHGVLQLDDTVYRGYFTGLAKGMENIGLTNVPWGAWLQPLAYWAPLIVLMSVCVMAMSLLVHRQWSEHEQLSYPIAQVASAFIKREKGKGVPDLFKSHLFWWGFVPVFLLYALEYIHLWFPVYVPGMNDIFPSLKVAELPIHDKFPLLTKCPQWWGIVYRTTYFSVIGLAYFVSTEISLTVGLAQVLLAVFAGWYFVATGGPVLDTEFTDMSISRCGAYIGYAAILIFTGRSYYKAIFMKAFSFSRPTEDDKASVMAARLTILSFTAFVAVLVVMGLDWLVALCFSLLLMLLFLVVTRVVCETGVPYVQAGWFPGSILVPLFGAAAVGPGPLVFAAWLGTILVQDPRSCLMPYMATGIKMAGDAKMNIQRLFWVLVGTVVIALAVAFVSTTWTHYDFGGITSSDGWASGDVPQAPFDNASRCISEMSDNSMLAPSSHAHGLAKLKLVSFDSKTMGFFAVGLLGVVIFSALRFRFSGFPLHPALFLIWGTFPAAVMGGSFLIGWAVKWLVVRFGGGRAYQNMKPFFIGLIAGELITVGATIFIDIIYYFITGHPPSLGGGLSALPG